MSDTPLLVLRGFGVAFGGTPVLAEVDLEIPRHGVVVLVGPAGSGKSTLLRTLAGMNDAHPSLTTWGAAELDGRPLVRGGGDAERGDSERRTGFVMQHSRFFMNTVRENLASALPNRSLFDRATQAEMAQALLSRSGLTSLVGNLDAEVVTLPQTLQRLLAIARATAGEPRLLLADEPTAGLDDDAAVDVLALLRAQAASRAVLFVTHNRRHALAAGGTTVLLAGGRVVEVAPTSTFFSAPTTEPGKRFVATGSCSVPSPGASRADLDEATPMPPPLPRAARAALEQGPRGARGFFWVLPGKLGGLPRPGIIAELDEDIAGLSRLGVDLLVNLEETLTVDPALLTSAGIKPVHFPINDMGAPTLAAAMRLCTSIELALSAGRVVAFHCRAGLGRTGTLLASQLIWQGETALRAIDRVRQINARCIQSDAQVEFLRELADAIRAARGSEPPSKLTIVTTQTEDSKENTNVA